MVFHVKTVFGRKAASADVAACGNNNVVAGFGVEDTNNVPVQDVVCIGLTEQLHRGAVDLLNFRIFVNKKIALGILPTIAPLKLSAFSFRYGRHISDYAFPFGMATAFSRQAG